MTAAVCLGAFGMVEKASIRSWGIDFFSDHDGHGDDDDDTVSSSMEANDEAMEFKAGGYDDYTVVTEEEDDDSGGEPGGRGPENSGEDSEDGQTYHGLRVEELLEDEG